MENITESGINCKDHNVVANLKPTYFSGTLILAILARGLVITKFNTQ